MKKIILALIIVLAIQSCKLKTSEKTKLTPVQQQNNSLNIVINDTFTLNDGHIYYSFWSHRVVPIHSQYCKNH